ncbi:MAG TPA: hypothetical protein ENN73_00190, partial [Firmicutes bacterium]|nr:hypothetical protein [Bacillota bacterium]
MDKKLFERVRVFLKDDLENLKDKGALSTRTISKIRGELENLSANILPLVPRGAYDKRMNLKERVSVLLYIDISGFTRMTEKLSKLGREGAEEITKVINSFFSPIINIIIENQGDIINFGGDSIEAVFPMFFASDSDFRFRALR